MGVLLADLAQREQPQAVVGALDVDRRPRVLAHHARHRDVGIGRVGAELLAVGFAGRVFVLVEAMQVGGVRRIDADLERLQPVAVDQPFEGEGMCRRCEEAVELGERRRLSFAEIRKDNAVLDHDRIGALADPLAEHRAFRLGGGLEARAVDIEQPAMEQAAQAAILEAAIGEIGAAMRAVAVEQTVPAALVAEQHEILAQHAHRLGRPFFGQLLGQRHRMPVMPHQGAALGARPDPRDQLVLLGRHHGKRLTQTGVGRKGA